MNPEKMPERTDPEDEMFAGQMYRQGELLTEMGQDRLRAIQKHLEGTGSKLRVELHEEGDLTDPRYVLPSFYFSHPEVPGSFWKEQPQPGRAEAIAQMDQASREELFRGLAARMVETAEKFFAEKLAKKP